MHTPTSIVISSNKEIFEDETRQKYIRTNKSLLIQLRCAFSKLTDNIKRKLLADKFMK